MAYKKHQKKELNEKLVHLENDIHLQKRKEAMMMEENKTLKEDLRNKNKEVKELKSEQAALQNQIKLLSLKCEHLNTEKQSETEQLKREVQRQREEKQ